MCSFMLFPPSFALLYVGSCVALLLCSASESGASAESFSSYDDSEWLSPRKSFPAPTANRVLGVFPLRVVLPTEGRPSLLNNEARPSSLLSSSTSRSPAALPRPSPTLLRPTPAPVLAAGTGIPNSWCTAALKKEPYQRRPISLRSLMISFSCSVT